MKKNALLILSIIFLSFIEISAQNETISLNNKWFFGVEIGGNHIASFDLDESKNSIQVGLLAEYYFTRKWSLTSKIKYYKTGVSFHQSGSSGLFGSNTHSGTFKGSVISIPVFAKWEFRVYRELKGNFKLGYAFNKEIKSQYSNYSNNLNTEDYSSQYGGLVVSYGFNYLNAESAIYLDFEGYSGAEKGRTSSLVSNGKIVTTNYLISLGYKYSFKN